MKEFRCAKCGNVYYSRDDLRYHIFNDHISKDVSAEKLDQMAGDGEKLRSAAIDSLRKSALSELLADAELDPGFGQEASAMITKAGYTHYILRNQQGRCVVVQIGQPIPPGWKVYYTGDEPTCRSYFHTRCGAGQGGNRC